MYAIVTAGGIPQPEDPLYAYSRGDSKALIDIAGKPMIQWTLDALNESREVEGIIIIGLSAKTPLVSAKPIHFISNQGRMLANIVAGINKALELDKKTEYVLVVSSDIPALKGEMVDWLVAKCMETEDELYYGVCPREVMEARYPNSNRTYTRLKGIELCGADIHVAHVRTATEHLDLWEKLIGNRKSPLSQASIVGFDTLWKVFTHSATLDELVEHVCKRIGIQGRVIVWDRAEPCMDVDKPNQLELMRADLESQRPAKKTAAPRIKKTAGSKAAPAKKKPTAAKKTAASASKTPAMKKPAAKK